MIHAYYAVLSHCHCLSLVCIAFPWVIRIHVQPLTPEYIGPIKCKPFKLYQNPPRLLSEISLLAITVFNHISLTFTRIQCMLSPSRPTGVAIFYLFFLPGQRSILRCNAIHSFSIMWYFKINILILYEVI